MRFSRGCMRSLGLVLALLLAAPDALLRAATTGPQLPDPGRVSITREQQQQLGLKAAAEVYKQMPILPDSDPLVQYVRGLGHKLEAVIPRQYSWPYQFHVVQESDINAFALPGGPIFVNVGTIRAAENEAELAGVMAHEMSHVYMQHSIKGAQKQGTAQGLGQIFGAILGSVLGGPAGALAQLGAQVGAGMISMKYSRADEAQADAVGAIIMYKAGYDPHYMARFFQRLEQQVGPGGPQFLSDHPNPGNRVEAVSKEIQDWPPRTYHNDSPQFAQARQEAQNVKAYSAQQIQQMAKSGQIHNTSSPAGDGRQNPADSAAMGNVTLNQVMPNGSYQAYRGNGISFRYPGNWQVMGGGQSLTIAPPAGVAQDAVAYGMILNSLNGNAASLDDVTGQLIANLQQSNPGMRQLGSLQPIRVNGVDGRSVDLSSTSPLRRAGASEPERDWLVSLAAPNGNVVYAVFIAPERDFSQLRPTYEQMLRSLHLQ